MLKLVPALTALSLVAGCASHGSRAQTPAAPRSSAFEANANLNAVLWVQTALEYDAGARQAYRLASAQLDAALADRSWTAALEQTGDASRLPPAVILDIDETVLDNSYYQARLIRDGVSYSTQTWDRWVFEERATAVPGALEFVRDAEQKGVTVFYVTNRTANLETATRNNLAALHFPLTTGLDTVLARGERPEWSASSKVSRRAFVASSYRILMLIGDDLGDFVGEASGTAGERASRTAPYAEWWGRRWIVLPNPTYGSWERAVVGAGQDALAARLRALKFADR